MNPNICNGAATANASASAAVRPISVCTLAAATDHTAGVGADRLLRNRLLASVHASTIDLCRKLTTQTCGKTTLASCSSVAVRHCSKVASHGHSAATRQVVLCTSAIMPAVPQWGLCRIGACCSVVVLQRQPRATREKTTVDLRVTVACSVPCGVLQCGYSHYLSRRCRADSCRCPYCNPPTTSLRLATPLHFSECAPGFSSLSESLD